MTPDGDRWRYAYDPLGRRIAKHRLTEDGSTADRTEFTWDDVRLAEQTTPDGRVTTWDYAPGTHRPLTQTDHKPLPREQGASLLAKLAEDAATDFRTRFCAVITDGLGTPAELVTVDGELAWQRRTTLWGTSRPTATDTTSADCPHRFPGQYADPETGLHYNYFRYYDPETARYISPDPLGLEPAPNPAAYIPNPHSWIDPLGLSGCTNPKPGETLGDVEKVRGWVPKTIPEESLQVLRDMKEYNLGWWGGPGFHGPKWWTETFENSGKNGGHQLPQYEPSGKPITYQEYGTYPAPGNPQPGGERWVFGSDGSAYYTPTHYQTYIVGRSPRWVE